MGSLKMTPQRERLITLFEKYKKNVDNGYVKAITEFSKECFRELQKLGDNATYQDVRKYICAAYNIGMMRYVEKRNKSDYEAIRRENDGIHKLDKGKVK